MSSDPVDRLVQIGFSEYEAKAYVALLRESPVTGYQLSKTSHVPRSMIYEVLGKLTARGAAMKLRKGDSTQYAPIPADEFLDQLRHEHEILTSSLKEDLATLASPTDMEYVWNIEGHDNIMAKATKMIDQAKSRVYLAIVPSMCQELRSALEKACERGVSVRLYTTSEVEMAGCRVVVAHVAEEILGQARGLGLILVIDGEEVLIGEWLTATQARASWTSSHLLVFIAEHHLRTDLYLPEILALLGDQALDIIQEEDRDLFARALESHIEG